MRIIIVKDGKNIAYENVSHVVDLGDDLSLLSEDMVEIQLNGWLIAKAASCKIEKRCLICVDEVFLDTREGGV